MPRWVENLIRKRGGVKKWRTIKRGGKLIRLAITKRAGSGGGHSIGYRVR